MEELSFSFPWGTVISVAVAVILVLIPLTWRRVVEPNEVHIVQRRKKRISYGAGEGAGNAYYEYPAWIPIIGVQTIVMPLSVFEIELTDYEAYDVGKVPFVVDVVAFFRVSDPRVAAERALAFDKLEHQLKEILRGATRSILAKSEIEEIMAERSIYGEQFTQEVSKHLKEWGTAHVKSIELMDIRDPKDGSSKTISDIMDKKKSFIERQSRVEVAENIRAAQVAEIEAQREVDVQSEQARETVGKRTAEANKTIGIQNELAEQEIKSQQRETAERDMEITRVREVRLAEIQKQQQIVIAEQDKETRVIKADGERQQDIIQAEADKKQEVLRAEGHKQGEELRAKAILAVGSNEADVLRKNELAPIQAQIELAQEIGENPGYQKYLVDIRDVERKQVVGVEQAQALKVADIRIITNSGTPTEGLDGVMDLFSPKGGTHLAAAAEAFSQTPVGEAILNRLGIDREPYTPDEEVA